MVDEGHSVQNHTWDHPYLTEISDEEIADQLERTTRAMVDAGTPEPLFVRPPFGDYDGRTIEMVESQGYRIATWTNALDTRDWDGPTSEELIERILTNLQDGGVVLLHDIQPTTVSTLPHIIKILHEKGYCIEQFNDEEFWNLDA